MIAFIVSFIIVTIGCSIVSVENQSIRTYLERLNFDLLLAKEFPQRPKYLEAVIGWSLSIVIFTLLAHTVGDSILLNIFIGGLTAISVLTVQEIAGMITYRWLKNPTVRY